MIGSPFSSLTMPVTFFVLEDAGDFLEIMICPLLNVTEQLVPSSNCSRTFLTLSPAGTFLITRESLTSCVL